MIFQELIPGGSGERSRTPTRSRPGGFKQKYLTFSETMMLENQISGSK